MLDQEKTGKYIAEKRKALGMTQKQLADQVGLTDKAVSKWERGKSIPDHAIMDDLCNVLQISINEFLAGEDIDMDSYPKKAEENIKNLIREQKQQEKNTKTMAVVGAAGCVFFLIGIYSVFLTLHYYFKVMTWFVDLPSLLFIIGVVLIILAVSGAAADFFRAFLICFGKDHTENRQVEKSKRAVKMVLVANILAAAFLFTGEAILEIPAALDNGELGQRITVLLVIPWYSFLLDLLLLPVFFHLENKKE